MIDWDKYKSFYGWHACKEWEGWSVCGWLEWELLGLLRVQQMSQSQQVYFWSQLRKLSLKGNWCENGEI